jgi:hypothetical protein
VTPASPVSPLLGALPGGVASDDPDRAADSGVAWHYGDPLREQRRLSTGDSWVDLSHRGVVTVTGPDRLTWLHSLLSQHLEQLRAGVGTEALLLSPHGHVEQHLQVVDDGDRTWLVTEPGEQSAFVAFLDSMRFLLRVEVSDVTDERAAVWLPPDVPTVPLVAAGGPLDAALHAAVRMPMRRGALLLVPRAQLAATAAALTEATGAPSGLWAFEALRVAAHEPRLHRETDHRTIPHEVGWIDAAVHLQKGCYRGQETVARVHNLGRPPRRLVLLHLDGSATDQLPTRGTDVTLGDRSVGFVGTAVHHFEDGPIALAVVKRAVDPDLPLTVSGSHPVGIAAAQEIIVAP